MLFIRPEFYSACCLAAIAQNAKRCPICRANLPYRTVARELRMGDRVRLFDGGEYNVGTVLRIMDGRPTVLRPYVQTSDTVYSHGLIGYLGYEEYTLNQDHSVIVLMESTLLEVRHAETDEGRKLRARP